MKPQPKSLRAGALSKEEFTAYGDLIQSPKNTTGNPANQGTASRFDNITTLINLRLSKATINSLPFSIKLLERHKFSTQLFIPMTPNSSKTTPKYLVIVALNDPQTDLPKYFPNSKLLTNSLQTLKAFVAESDQGINYHCGTWHHPMIALPHGGEIDFLCMVHNGVGENTNASDDCQEVFYGVDEQIVVEVDFNSSRD